MENIQLEGLFLEQWKKEPEKLNSEILRWSLKFQIQFLMKNVTAYYKH